MRARISFWRMSTSSNLALPYLAGGQAQKHVTVNEALLRLDALTQLVAEAALTSAEPADPVDGALYILPPGKTGDAWGAMANHALAYWRDGVWEEIAPRTGWRAYAKDIGAILVFTGAAWLDAAAASGAWRVIAASGISASHTGSTSETTLASIILPGGALGPHGALRISSQWSHTNSANNKTLRYRLGGSVLMAPVLTASASSVHQRSIQNRGVTNAQVTHGSGFPNSFGGTTNAVVTTSVDTTVDQTLTITGQLATGGESVVLESYLIEVASRN
ncbi:MAG TPA: DUF2793 domain-containing protein [Terricaulis sp.]|nr:DUF2793 domain-containing protein [Terricaulis sp.]